ncbi:MAG TPA: protein rhiA [Symbiobacteriaceae bacterium]|nr:protein rhiA [Symbiobacteriaceae bacterium]
MSKYVLIVKNNSNLEGDICVYQASPDMQNPSVMSLAWFAQHVHPTTITTFEWTLDYCFFWEETGSLASGINCTAKQIWPADLAEKNAVTLTHTNGAFTFTNLGAAEQKNALQIQQDATVPLHAATVGIGMAGAGTFGIQTAPNIEAMFTPHPAYWVTLGQFVQGQVLNVTEITNKVQIEFPPNVFVMEATLQPDNTWTVTPAQL